jgi:hypothetical protein
LIHSFDPFICYILIHSRFYDSECQRHEVPFLSLKQKVDDLVSRKPDGRASVLLWMSDPTLRKVRENQHQIENLELSDKMDKIEKGIEKVNGELGLEGPTTKAS